MNETKNYNLLVVPESPNPKFEQRESGITHMEYQKEINFYSKIREGDVEGLLQALEFFRGKDIVVGRLSKNPLRQIKYWSVCCITLATRYAIEGGLSEMEAYNFSDEIIMKIDELTSAEDVERVIKNAMIKYAEEVREKSIQSCPAVVKECLYYIEKHLHENINLRMLADKTYVSEGYLSKLFKKHTGKKFKEYVTEKKLESAKLLLEAEGDINAIAYSLGFCSQTYFTTRFREKYNITPLQYRNNKKAHH